MKRRSFIINIAMAGVALMAPRGARARKPLRMKPEGPPEATVFRALNGSPDKNLLKVIEMMGGIHHFVGPKDVVAIKPNVQWWNQGVPNLLSIKTLVDAIFQRQGGFDGEVLIIENVHRGDKPWKHAGWSTQFDLNADMTDAGNYNELCGLLKKRYGDRFSTIHLINAKDGGRRIYGPAEGPGYVYCDGTGGLPLIEMDNGAKGDAFRKVIMTYPILKSDRGTIVDFRYGVWESGSYTQTPFKFINIAGINHHSTWCGVSSTIKNYLGISDLSGGPDPFDDGKLTEAHYNFHSFPFDKWAPGPKVGMIGAEIGRFLTTIRRADLNIVTAQWIGLGDRIVPPLAHTRCVAASTDPVALDYHCAKHILYPNSAIAYHDPDDTSSPTHQYIKSCADHGGGIFDERKVDLVSYDNGSGSSQDTRETAVIGEKVWGSNIKEIGKYLMMRYARFLL